MIAYALIAGILFGLYYGLLALGLNLVYGVMRIVNLAHGDFVMLAAYGAWVMYDAYHVGVWPTMAGAIVAFALAGVAICALFVPRLQRSHDPEMRSLILFFGLSQTIEALVTLRYGTTERALPSELLAAGPITIAGQMVPAAWAVSGVVSLVALAVIYVYLYRTDLGLQTRAVMSRREEAQISGIDVQRVSAIAFGVGLMTAAVAGVLSPFMIGVVTPNIGVGLTITSFAVIVIGSLGNPLGTIVGGVVYGIALMLMQTYFSSWANLLPNLLLIAILLVRPSGLFGRAVRHA